MLTSEINKNKINNMTCKFENGTLHVRILKKIDWLFHVQTYMAVLLNTLALAQVWNSFNTFLKGFWRFISAHKECAHASHNLWVKGWNVAEMYENLWQVQVTDAWCGRVIQIWARHNIITRIIIIRKLLCSRSLI